MAKCKAAPSTIPNARPLIPHIGTKKMMPAMVPKLYTTGASEVIKNRLNTMSVAEIMNLFTDTALEGFDPANPLSWHWGIAALGGGAISTMSEGFLKERTLSEIKDGAMDALKKGAGVVKGGASASADVAKKGAAASAAAAKKGVEAGAAAAKIGADAAKKGADAAAKKIKYGAQAAADLFKKKKD